MHGKGSDRAVPDCAVQAQHIVLSTTVDTLDIVYPLPFLVVFSVKSLHTFCCSIYLSCCFQDSISVPLLLFSINIQYTIRTPLLLPPCWPSGKASTSRVEDPRLDSRLHQDFFQGQVIPVTSKLALQWLPCKAPGVIWSALGLVGLVSVYCDWVR